MASAVMKQIYTLLFVNWSANVPLAIATIISWPFTVPIGCTLRNPRVTLSSLKCGTSP